MAWRLPLPSNPVRALMGAFLIACVAPGSLRAHRVAGELGEFLFENWRTEEGLPQNSIQAITQTRDGYLWVATRFGLARFNGVDFHVYDAASTGGLLYEDCTALLEDSQTNLWIGTQRGLYRLHQGEFTCFTVNSVTGRDSRQALVTGLPDRSIHCLCASRRGGFWVGTDNGVALMAAGVFRPFLRGDGTNALVAQAMHEDEGGALWVGTPRGLRKFRYDDSAGTLNELASGETPGAGPVICVRGGRQGRVWVGGMDGLRRFDADGGVTHFTTAQGLASNRVEVVFEDRSGTVWAATPGAGLSVLRSERFEPLAVQSGVVDPFVAALCEDREGNHWVGTVYGGLYRMQHRRIASFAPGRGPGLDHVWSVCAGRSNRVWMATEGGLSWLTEGRVKNLPRLPGQRHDRARSVLEDREGTLWVGTVDFGLARLRDGRFDYFDIPRGWRVANTVRALFQSRSGVLWVGTEFGLARFELDHLVEVPVSEQRVAVCAILEDHEGRLWVGTDGSGLFCVRDGNRVDWIRGQNGLSSEDVWAIHEDSRVLGVLWVGTNNGLNRLRVANRSITVFTRNEGLFDNLVNHILEDNQGDLWISCNRGVSRVRKRHLDEVARGHRATVDSLVYGTEDGMLSRETNGENQPAGCKTANGHLWFPTTEGVVEIDPERVPRNGLAPPVVIEQVRVDNRDEVNPAAPVNLPAGKGRVLELRYTGNSLIASDRIQFRYRLEGYDRDWTEAGTRRVVHYTNLRPGRYVFRVTARNSDAVWNDAGAAFSFAIAPHFHETPFFVGFCGVSLLAAGWGWHQVRLRRHMELHALEREVALERERSRIAQDMHDDVGSSLTQITLLGEMAQSEATLPPAAEQHLRLIATKARAVVTAMDEIVWAVNPKNDSLENLATYVSQYARDFLEQARVRCRLDIPAVLPDRALGSEVRHHLFLSVKEALNNVVKHAAASEVQLRLAADDAELRIVVEDDGKGLPESAAANGGDGLRNMRERLRSVGGRFELSRRPGGGTRVTLRILLASS